MQKQHKTGLDAHSNKDVVCSQLDYSTVEERLFSSYSPRALLFCAELHWMELAWNRRLVCGVALGSFRSNDGSVTRIASDTLLCVKPYGLCQR